MRLVLAEKPSVARDIAKVLGATRRRQGWLEGEGVRVAWCIGHLAELQEPAHYRPEWKSWRLDHLPMLPEAFALRARGDVADHVEVLRRLLTDPQVTEVINACDAGREGELIFRYVAQLVGCPHPVQRLWVSSLTDTAIRQGFARLRPGSDYDGLADAARCRAEADWLVGLNATRALTCRARDGGPAPLLSVGRVQTPTLAMVVERDRAIAAFEPEAFWQVKADFESGEHGWSATWFRGKAGPTEAKRTSGEVDKSERFSSQADAEAVVRAARGQPGQVVTATRKRTTERPPLLYDLTSLQRRANQRYGLSAQATLDLAQALYEKHKLITYPRTDARHLLPDQVPELPDIVRGLLPIPAYAEAAQAVLAAPIQPGKRVVNAAEVGDHPAILPTGRTPSSRGLSPDEKRVYDLIARRLLAALSPDALFDVTLLVTEVEPGAPLPAGIEGPLRFRARGRVCRQQGWRAIDPPPKRTEVELPPVETGDAARVDDIEAVEGKTRPPRPHTDASLLRSMEVAGRGLDDRELARAMRSCGLGTPATRAAILQTLLRRNYMERKGKHLHATEQGCALIDAVPVEGLKSAALTGRWEGRLARIAESEEARDPFMHDIRRYVTEVVDAVRAAPAPRVAADATPQGKVLGACPACGQPVREQGPVYTCDTGRSCPFVVFATMSRRKISVRTVRQLLAEGRSKPLSGFKSKKGNPFSAGLVWNAEEGRVGFWFPDEPPKVGDRCPRCGTGRLMQGRTTLGCDRWREGCAYRVGEPTTPGPAGRPR